MRRIARLQCLNGRYRFRAGVPSEPYDTTPGCARAVCHPECPEPGRFTLRPFDAASFALAGEPVVADAAVE